MTDHFKNDPWIIVDRLADVILAAVDGCVVDIGIGYSTEVLLRHSRKMKRSHYSVDISGRRCDWAKSHELSHDLHVVKKEKSTMFGASFEEPIAILFLDGNHKAWYVKKELEIFLGKVSDGGVTFMHDTCPLEGYFEKKQAKGKAMDTYTVRQELESRSDLNVFTWPYTAANCGLTMVMKKIFHAPHYRV